MPIGVEMTFRVPNNSGAEHVKIDASDVKVPSTASWKEGEEPPKPPAGSFVYSGRHDHGVLLTPRGGGDGDMAHLIAAVHQAKEASNEYLTRIIEREKATTTAEPSTKRTKVEEGVEDG